ncbi:MAG: universal stress protein [Halobacteriaceae archaeon]
MVSQVLVPMDDSEMAKKALRYALKVHSDADITVFHVVGEPSAMMGEAVSLALEDDIQQAAEELSESVFEKAREIASEYNTEIHTAVAWGTPAKEIVKRASNFDVVILGSHAGSIAERIFIGNVAKTVFQRSPVPVTVVR